MRVPNCLQPVLVSMRVVGLRLWGGGFTRDWELQARLLTSSSCLPVSGACRPDCRAYWAAVRLIAV